MPIAAASSEVQFYMDRAGGGGGGGERDCSNKESKAMTSHHNHSSHHSGGGTAGGTGAGYRILKVRVSDQCDKDFVEIDLPTEKLSIQGFLEVSCQELGLEYPVHIERIRKMPNTRLRRDIEVQRLHNYQELELVLSKHPVALPAPHHHHPSSSSAHPHPLSHSHSYLNSVNNPSGSPRTTTTDMVL
ncbi:uncharacterized protein LOC142339349 [Convolutriloba macropyga]|uniref:uncharacterized protein LOC142339349 n=1 Tax=Convolutriloba macropyga TaxID=536237 RepID=UPI003F520826